MAKTTVVLISGANTGIGFEIAKKLLTDHENLHVFLGSRTLEKGNKAVDDLKIIAKASNIPEAVQLDITSDSSIALCVDTIKSTTGHLDVLINNAGIAPMTPDNTPDSVRKAFSDAYNTNVTSTCLMTGACIPLLAASPHVPRIIFITSGLSSLTRVGNIPSAQAQNTSYRPYVTSKSAMNMLAVMYGAQFRDLGWKVNLVCPGLRKTKLNNFMENATDPSLGAIEAVKLAMDGSKAMEGAKEGEGKTIKDGMWDWDGSKVPW